MWVLKSLILNVTETIMYIMLNVHMYILKSFCHRLAGNMKIIKHCSAFSVGMMNKIILTI